MKFEKLQEALREVLDEIDLALRDPRGLKYHQRRLALMLSVGVCTLLLMYFQKQQVLKSGSHIKHQWLRQQAVHEKLEQQIICSLSTLPQIGEIIHLACSIEEQRDDLAYGSPLHEDKILEQKIKQFLELKNIIEEHGGSLL